MHYASIMAGGSGSRLWPMSRKAKPKQFHSLVSEKTLLQETYHRVVKAVKPESIFLSTTIQYVEEIRVQLPKIPEKNYIIEPLARNTAPALGLISLKISRMDPDATISTIPSDHIVNNVDGFVNTFKIASKTVKKFPGNLVVIGIKPTKPDTGLGYIKMGSQKCKIDGERIFQVTQLIENPNIQTAKDYIKSWE